MTPQKAVGKPEADVMITDTCWRASPEGATKTIWYLLTLRGPREMRLEPMGIYFPRSGPTRYQYALARRPKGAKVLPP